MKNNILILSLLIMFGFFNTAFSQDVFNFDVTEAKILNDGNIFKGIKRGVATSEDGTIIHADNFEYDKLTNILKADGNVIIDDPVNKTKIFTEDITYLKNEEIIFTKGRSKAVDETSSIDADRFEYKKKLNILNASGNVIIDDPVNKTKIFTEDITYLKNEEIIYTESRSTAVDEKTFIVANRFEYKKKLNILNAKGNVEIINKVEDYILYTEEITYEMSQEKFFTQGYTEAIIQSKYNFKSENVVFFKNEMRLISSDKSTLEDAEKSTIYKLDEFEYYINEQILKGQNILVITNYLKPKSDKTYFVNGIFDFKSSKFSAKDTKILLHKNLFNKERVYDDNANNIEKKKIKQFEGKNDPRIYGVSSSGNKNQTIINKGIFTSCKKNDNCPPWSLKADTITHDKIKQNVIYKNAILNVFDVPVFYFPKFFHPDPSVERRSGLLQPRLNSSSTVGTSLNIPYFHVISDNKDLTLKPTIFDDRIYMFQSEYRQKNQKSSFIADFGYTKGYKSKMSNNRNGMSHILAKYNLDLDLESFDNSKLDVFFEKVTMDTFLGVFEGAILADKIFENDLKDHGTMTSGLILKLDNEDYSFTSGLTSYESLSTSKNSDRYTYVLPYYNFSTSLFSNSEGTINFSSSGDNILRNTNNLKSLITNNINYQTTNIYSKLGFVSNYGVYIKNLNAVAKNDSRYRSKPQSEILNINEFNITYPMIKDDQQSYDFLTPKISFRINPSNMKNHSGGGGLLTTDSVFAINRLGLSESYESGKTLTFGIDYRKENKIDIDKFFEVKLAQVLRDTPEYKIPKASSLQQKNSNIFGSVENKFSKFFTFNYDFSLDNDFSTFEHNNIIAEFEIDNFISEFHFHEQNGKAGSSNYYSNTSTISFDDNNSLIFKTRRNRKISLTEYYDFIYEYQNDCLTAAIKYRKTYYQDRDITPKEDLFFTITLFPLTTIDQKIDPKLYRDDEHDIIWK